MDWIRAALVAAALLAFFLAGAIVIALLVPILSFLALVLAVWFLLKLLEDEDEPRKPP